MSNFKAIALQGIGFGSASLALQGYRSKGTVTKPTQIRFAPYLRSNQTAACAIAVNFTFGVQALTRSDGYRYRIELSCAEAEVDALSLVSVQKSCQQVVQESHILSSQALTRGSKYVSSVSAGSIKAITPTLTTHHMSDFSIKKGNTLPRLKSTLRYNNGQPVVLTGAQLLEFIYKPARSEAPAVVRVGTILNYLLGEVEYAWTPADTAVPGDYVAEWRVTFAGDGQLSVPNDETFITFKVNPGLV